MYRDGSPIQNLIGKSALLLVLLEDEINEGYTHTLEQLQWKYCMGKVGSMEPHKVVAAIETAAKKHQLIKPELYRESHALITQSWKLWRE